jgi:hypothetical protein
MKVLAPRQLFSARFKLDYSYRFLFCVHMIDSSFFFTKRDRRCRTETVLLLREGISGAFDFALRIAAPFIFSRLKSALPCLTRCCLVLRDYELFWHFLKITCLQQPYVSQSLHFLHLVKIFWCKHYN